MNNRLKTFIFPSLIFIISILLLIFFLQPQLKKLNENNSLYQEKKQELAELAAASEKLSGLEVKTEEVTEKLKSVSDAFVPEDNALSIIVSLEELANQTGLEQTISVNEKGDQSIPASGSDPETLAETATDLWQNETYFTASIQLRGSFANLQKYLLLLHHSAKAYYVNSIQVLAQETDSAQSKINANLSIKFFTQEKNDQN